MLKKIRKDKEKSHAAGDSEIQRTECTPCNFFRCIYVDYLIAKCPKSPKKQTNDERPFISTNGVILHCKKNPRTVMMINIKIYMHLWHVFLVLRKSLVEILVTVCS